MTNEHIKASGATAPTNSIFNKFEIKPDGTDFLTFADDEDDLVSVAVKVPHKLSFICTLAEPVGIYRLLRYDPEIGDRCYYLAASGVADALPHDVKPYSLYRYVDRRGREGLWPVPVPQGHAPPFVLGEMAAISEASKSWCRILWNAQRKTRQAIRAGGITEEPMWSERDREGLLAAAFGDRQLLDLEHTLVVELLGAQ